MCFLLHNGKIEKKNTKIKIARQKYGDDMHDTTSGWLINQQFQTETYAHLQYNWFEYCY